MRQKKSIFACGTPDDSNTKTLKSLTISNDVVNNITAKSLLPPGNTNFKIEDFIEIEAKGFVNKLKVLSVLGLDQ
jgi:hypothetical protein